MTTTPEPPCPVTREPHRWALAYPKAPAEPRDECQNCGAIRPDHQHITGGIEEDRPVLWAHLNRDHGVEPGMLLDPAEWHREAHRQRTGKDERGAQTGGAWYVREQIRAALGGDA